MQNVNLFELSSTFETTSGGTLAYPNTSLVKETNQIHFSFSKQLYEWVDLGLPSGLKWADKNVGADKPEEYGLYFAWGENEGYTGDDVNNGIKQFSWSDYKWCNGSNATLTKYNTDSYDGIVDNLTTLELLDDAAYVSDNTCRMPTKDDFEELTANTTSNWEALNGVEGRRFTSKTNNNSIFIPAACNYKDGWFDNDRTFGILWSSSLEDGFPSFAWYLTFLQTNMFVGKCCDNYRCFGYSVRAVKD